MSAPRINILHLRASEGGGGGPEKTILKTSLAINTYKFWHGVCYLRKFGVNLDSISSRYHQNSLPYFEIPGNKVDILQFRKIVTLIKHHRVHILHTHDSKTIIFGVVLKALLPNLILVTTLHGWIRRRWRSRFYQWLAETGLKSYDAVVAVSDDLKQKIRQKGISRVIRIYNAIDVDEWRWFGDSKRIEENNHTYTVGYIGRISREKGPDQFLKVARILADLDDNIRFLMIGEGPLTSWVKTEIQSLDLEHKFTLTGYIPQTEIDLIYSRLNILLSTSHTEGLPNTILEALACGVPVVATRVGGVPELVTHGYNGALADDGDFNNLAHSVLDLKKDPQWAARFSRNGRSSIQTKFSFPKRVAAMENLYQNLVLRGQR